jgi:hypothetical protein
MIVAISGANKDIGKSSLASYLIAHCRSCAAAKFTLHREEPAGASIIEETLPDSEVINDTARMRQAGAFPVYWVRTTRDSLERRAGEVMKMIGEGTVILEGNSVLEYVRPDYAVFIMGAGFDGFKESAWKALAAADTILVNGDAAIAGAEAIGLEKRCKELSPGAKIIFACEVGRDNAYAIILSRIIGRPGGDVFMQDLDQRIVKELRARAEDGRIPCGVALKLAEELGVSPQEVGRAANELKIKVMNCSLGCF